MGVDLVPHPDETKEGEDGPEERIQDGARRQHGQGDDVAPPVLLLLGLAGPSGQPGRDPHHQRLAGVQRRRNKKMCHCFVDEHVQYVIVVGFNRLKHAFPWESAIEQDGSATPTHIRGGINTRTKRYRTPRSTLVASHPETRL